ncbi:MAG: class I SAM-dependent methyltransferase [Planctomycetes bacterium]|nr:class I SAM-dependent methyltransferase [Planctomycetota bacterium]
MTDDTDKEAVRPETADEKPKAKARRRVRCPVCAAHGEPTEADDHVVRCGECEVAFRNPRPSVGEILARRDARFAGALTRNHAAAIREAARAAVEAMRGYHRLMSGKDAPLNAFGKRVLDVGCGLGFRLREFEKYGWTVTGLEPSANASAYTQAVALHVVRADLEALRPGPFDFLLLEGVLEETADPAKVVGRLKDVLALRGVAYAGVRVADAALGDTQLYAFSEDGLRCLFMSSGFAEPEVRRDEGFLRMWFRRK